MSSAASAPVSAPSGPSLTSVCSQPVLHHRVVERIGAAQHWRDVVLDDAERGQAALHRRRLADPHAAVIGPDAHESASFRRRIRGGPCDLESLDPVDLHAIVSLWVFW
jgi:hypothetical protein